MANKQYLDFKFHFKIIKIANTLHLQKQMLRKRMNPDKKTVLKGSNITCVLMHQKAGKVLKKHSKFVFKQIHCKLQFEKLIQEEKQAINQQKKIQKRSSLKRPITASSHASNSQVLTLQRQKIKKKKQFASHSIYSNTMRNYKMHIKNIKQRHSFEKDQQKMVENGWKDMIESKRFSHDNFKKLRYCRDTFYQRKINSMSLYNKNQKQVDGQIDRLMKADPKFIYKFITGFTEDIKQEDVSHILDLKKAQTLLLKSPYLQRVYKQIINSDKYTQIKPHKLQNSFLALVYLLELKNKQIILSEKQKNYIRKLDFGI